YRKFNVQIFASSIQFCTFARKTLPRHVGAISQHKSVYQNPLFATEIFKSFREGDELRSKLTYGQKIGWG
mgnify:CR=1